MIVFSSSIPYLTRLDKGEKKQEKMIGKNLDDTYVNMTYDRSCIWI